VSYLVEDWWRLLPTPWPTVGLALVAILCGAIVGSERERHEKPAGLRTLVLVCLGSAAFTMASFAFTTTTGDSGRVAAQIVTGIGFLGAGVILRESIGVTGATTAASIWITAAMGMVVGSGRAGAGVGLAILIRTTLVVLHAIEGRWIAVLSDTTATIVFDPDHGKTRFRIEHILVESDHRYDLRELGPAADGLVRARVSFRLPRRHGRELLAELAALPEVREIREESA